MTSLARCIEKHKVKPADAHAILAAMKEHVANGYGAKHAEATAVEDYLDALRETRRSVMRQLIEHGALPRSATSAMEKTDVLQGKEGEAEGQSATVAKEESEPTPKKSGSKPDDIANVIANASAEDKTQPAAPGHKSSAAKIEDFGEKLGGARKDMPPAIVSAIGDDEIASKSFAEIWPKAAVDAIEDIEMASIAHAIRETVPAKPRAAQNLRRWVNDVKRVRELMRLVERDGGEALLKKLDEGHYSLGQLADKIRFLRHFERAQWPRIGSVANYPDSYTYDKDGKKTAKPNATAQVDGGFVSAANLDELRAQVAEKLGVKAPERKMRFEARTGVDGKVYIVKTGDSLRRRLATFDTAREALLYRNQHHAELVAAWEKIKERDNVHEKDVRGAENRPRVGAEHRSGKDATAQMFTSAFGLRGVEFGNWVSQGKNQRERQGMLNAVYDALMDLADIAGIPPRAISLNGTLGLGLGSRGHGWASAHYEPDTLVINLTKTRGAGSLAHEWFHALDNYFQRQRQGKPQKETAHGGAYITFQPEPYYENSATGQRLSAARFAKVTVRNPAEWTRIEGVRPEVEQSFAALVRALNASPMSKRSRLIDSGKSGGYWSRIIERAARSFENYVISRMQQRGYHNDYLANVLPPDRFERDKGRYPYLLESEVEPIAEAFQDLFSTVKTRETDRGVELYSTSERGGMGGLTASDIRETLKWAKDVKRNQDGTFTVTAPNGATVRIESVDRIDIDAAAFKVSYGRPPTRAELRRGAAGSYAGGVIRIAKSGDRWTLAHEDMHWLEDLGILSASDIEVLTRATGKDNATTEDAYRLAETIREKKSRISAIGRVMQKIRDFIDSFVNLFKRTAAGVVRDVESGKIFDRAVRGESIRESMSEEFQAGAERVTVGRIDDAVAHALHLPTADIRLERSSLDYIERKHGGQIRQAGYADATDFVSSVAERYEDIYEGKSGALILRAPVSGQNKSSEAAFIKLSPDPSGSFYRVTNAFPIRADYFKTKRLLWKRAQSSSKQPVGSPPLKRTGESSRFNKTIDGANDPVKTPKDNYSVGREINDYAAQTLGKIVYRQNKPDTNPLDKIISQPLWHFAKVPALRKMFDAAMQWMDDKHIHLRRILYDEHGKAMNAEMDAFRRQRPDEHKAWNARLIEMDANKRGWRAVRVKGGKGKPTTWNVLSPDKTVIASGIDSERAAWDKAIDADVADYRSTVAGASDQGAQALRTFRRINHNMYDTLRSGIQDLIKRFEEAGRELPKVAWVDEDGKTVHISLRAALAKMGDLRASYVPRIRRPGRLRLIAKKEGANPRMEFFDLGLEAPDSRIAKAFNSAATPLGRRANALRRDGYDVSISRADAMPESVFLELAGKALSMQAIINQALERVGNQGKHVGLGDIGMSGEWENGDYILTARDGVKEQAWRDAIEEMGGKYQISGNWGKSFSPRWTFENAGGDIEARLAKRFVEIGALTPDVDLLFAEAITQGVADMLRGRGARVHMLKRSEATGVDVWKGYEEDAILSVTKAAAGIAGADAKKELGRKLVTIITGTEESWRDFKDRMRSEGHEATHEDYRKQVRERRIDPAKQPNVHAEAESYMHELLRNQETADRVIGTLKAAATLKYLGFRVAAPLSNMTAMVTSVPASMSKWAGIPLARTGLLLGQAYRAITQYRLGNAPAVDPWIRRVLQEGDQRGWFDSQHNKEAMEVMQTKGGRAFATFMDWSMALFGATEKLNRSGTILATYMGLKRQAQLRGKVWNANLHDEAMAKAKEVSDKAHGIYGKGNLPYIARGPNAAAQTMRTFYVFKTFSHNYLLNMAHMGFGKESLYMAFAPAILAGAGASVATPIIAAIAKTLGWGDDPEEELYEWIERNWGTVAGEFARTGAAGMGGAGVSLKGSLAVGIGDLPTTIADLLGAPGSVITDLYDGGVLLSRGDVTKGIEKLSPSAIGGAVRGLREATEGVTTKSNAPVFYGNEQLKATPLEVAMRALSFNPARIASIRERQWREKQSLADLQEKRSEIYAMARKFMLLPAEERTKERWAPILEDISDFNLKIRGNRYNDLGANPITSKTLRNAIRRAFRPSRLELLRYEQSEPVEIERGERYATIGNNQ